MLNNKFIFISHAEKDIAMTEKFVDLLYSIGVSENSIVCSSISELGVPIKADIYEYLRGLLSSEEVIPVFVLSDNYYSSPACLNEMGAVWVKQKEYFMFLLPDFEFSEIKGAINPRKRGISLGYKSERELQNLKEDLNQFRKEVCNLLNIEQHGYWERKRDEFINQIQKLKMDTEYINISLNESEGCCVGEHTNDGCIVTFDKFKNKICSTIDFMKTNAEICSVIIYIGDLDMSNQYMADKKLVFDLKSTETISSLEVECRLENRNVRTTIATSSDWEYYTIPLSEFGGGASEWKALKEIKFLFRREDVSGGRIQIKDMSIK